MEVWKEFFAEKKKIAAALLLVCSFWSIFYPELTLTGDSYQKVGEESAGDVSEDYYEILNARPGDVEIRISFLEFVSKRHKFL